MPGLRLYQGREEIESTPVPSVCRPLRAHNYRRTENIGQYLDSVHMCTMLDGRDVARCCSSEYKIDKIISEQLLYVYTATADWKLARERSSHSRLRSIEED